MTKEAVPQLLVHAPLLPVYQHQHRSAHVEGGSGPAADAKSTPVWTQSQPGLHGMRNVGMHDALSPFTIVWSAATTHVMSALHIYVFQATHAVKMLHYLNRQIKCSLHCVSSLRCVSTNKHCNKSPAAASRKSVWRTCPHAAICKSLNTSP